MKWSDVYTADAAQRVAREEQAYQRIGHRRHKTPTPRKVTHVNTIDVLSTKFVFLSVFAIVAVALLFSAVNQILTPVVEASSISAPYYAEAPDVESADENNVPAQREQTVVNDIALEAITPTENAATNDIPFKMPSKSTYEYSRVSTGTDWTHITSDDFVGLSTHEKVNLIGAIAHDDMMNTGIPASLTCAQAILESAWMESSLNVKYENYFGIKISRGSNWEGSTWDINGADNSAYMPTKEEYDGVVVEIHDSFRTYDCLWDSVRDHSAYLANSGLYDGIRWSSFDDAVDIVVRGGYAMSSDYYALLHELADMYDLRRFDVM